MYIVFFVQSIHQPNIDKNENTENIDRPLLSKPKSELKATESDVIQRIFPNDTRTIRAQKPNTEQND